jgi:hypothetical protein
MHLWWFVAQAVAGVADAVAVEQALCRLFSPLDWREQLASIREPVAAASDCAAVDGIEAAAARLLANVWVARRRRCGFASGDSVYRCRRMTLCLRVCW